MLVPARALLGVATEAIRQALAGRTGTEAKSFGEAIVQADRYVDRHVYSVARCQHEEMRANRPGVGTTVRLRLLLAFVHVAAAWSGGTAGAHIENFGVR
jgi:hypothetical protein